MVHLRKAMPANIALPTAAAGTPFSEAHAHEDRLHDQGGSQDFKGAAPSLEPFRYTMMVCYSIL